MGYLPKIYKMYSVFEELYKQFFFYKKSHGRLPPYCYQVTLLSGDVLSGKNSDFMGFVMINFWV